MTENWVNYNDVMDHLKITRKVLDHYVFKGFIKSQKINRRTIMFDLNSISFPMPLIQCKICGVELPSLESHLKNYHGLTANHYCKMFLSARTRQDVSDVTAQKIKEKTLGRKCSDETLLKMRNSRLGTTQSLTTRLKRGASLKGRIITEEAKAKAKITRGDKYRGANHPRFKAWQEYISDLCQREKLELVLRDFEKDRIYLRCLECQHEFNYTKSYLMKRNTHICPKCFCRRVSKQERELLELIQSVYGGQILTSDRTMLNRKEIDIYLPELKIGFEFTGLYWHSVGIGNRRKFHLLEKINLANSKGIRLYTIFESEWLTDRDSVKEKIRTILSGELLPVSNDETLTLSKQWFNEKDLLAYVNYQWDHCLLPEGKFWKNFESNVVFSKDPISNQIFFDCGYFVMKKCLRDGNS